MRKFKFLFESGDYVIYLGFKLGDAIAEFIDIEGVNALKELVGAYEVESRS